MIVLEDVSSPPTIHTERPLHRTTINGPLCVIECVPQVSIDPVFFFYREASWRRNSMVSGNIGIRRRLVTGWNGDVRRAVFTQHNAYRKGNRKQTENVVVQK